MAAEAFDRQLFDTALNSSQTGLSYADIERDDLVYFELVKVLGRTFIANGDIAAAEGLARESVETARKAFGEVDNRVLDLSMDVLALILYQERTFEADVLRQKIDLLIDSVDSPDHAAFWRRQLEAMMAGAFAKTIAALASSRSTISSAKKK